MTPPGVGKTHLAIGIGLKAITAGFKVLFTSMLALNEILELAQLKNELKKKINELCKYDLLIVDELGYLPLDKQSNYNLFQLIHFDVLVSFINYHNQQRFYPL